MSANFTPSLDGYQSVGNFRFWCQKVLPLVYDDSLSYYELLCKVVDYLNKLIDNDNAEQNNIKVLLDAYNELQDYVNHYFDNLDVQEEINNKLDSMIVNGTLQNIINNYLYILYGITFTEYIHNNGTHYYITEIPKEYNGISLKLRQYLSNDSYGKNPEKVRDISYNKKIPCAFNTALFDTSSGKLYGKGFIIQDGNVITDVYNTNTFECCGIDENGDIKTYKNDASLTSDNLLNDGIVSCCFGYYTLIKNNQSVYPTNDDGWEALYQRQVFCQLTNGNYIIFTCNGGGYRNTEFGMSYKQISEILLSKYSIKIGYCFDGGGSTSTVINNEFINIPTDTSFESQRKVYCAWGFEPSVKINDTTNIITKNIGDNKERIQTIYAREMYNNTHYGYNEIFNQITNNEEAFFRKTFNWGNLQNVISIRKDGIAYLINNNNIFQIKTDENNSILLNGIRCVLPRNIIQTNNSLNILDLNDVNYSESIYCLENCLNTPNSAIRWLVNTYFLNSVETIYQIAFPLSSSETYKTMLRYKTPNSNFTQWRNL